ncbi:MAG: thioesterase [Bdellovibrionales bacterium]|nr:thioesterase [Bdellovibrionales bacterium]
MASSFLPLSKRNSAEHRLILFHHAGGSSMQYHSLAAYLPETWDVYAVDLPGRGCRTKLPLQENFETLLETLTKEMHELVDRPTFVVGHSMGSLLAFELVFQLESLGCRDISLLAVSNMVAPKEKELEISLPFDIDSKEDLMEYLRSAGGLPEEIQQRSDILDYYLNIIRADLKALKSYSGHQNKTVQTPILGCVSTEDPLSTPEKILRWSQRTTGSFSLKLFEGSHFYLFERPQNFIDGLMRSWEFHR